MPYPSIKNCRRQYKNISRGLSPAEALKKFKELYDSGVISAAEYQGKRKKYLDRL